MRLSAVLLLFVSSLFVKPAQCQSDELTIQGQTGKLYLQHTVVAKENWYSVGRLYNLSPKVIAPFNNLTLANPLTIGQQLEIPLTATNFSQNEVKDASETLVPVYHVVQEKEWMYRVSVNNNKVPIPSLEKWNHITRDQVHAGMHLIVGFLKVKTALSAFAKSGNREDVAVKTPAVTKPPVTTNPTGSTEENNTVVAPSNVPPPPPPVKKQPVKPADAAMTDTKQDKDADGDAQLYKTPVVNKPPVTANENTTAASSTAPPPVKNTTTVNTPAINFNGGFFKSDYSNAGKSADGQAGTFKSTSGWQDGKYYALMNNLPVGTIVRITSTNTRKSIYAKVLGQLPDMKESAGLTIRVSNAAASELGEGEGRFAAEVRY